MALTEQELDLLRGVTNNPETLNAIALLDRKREGERLMKSLGCDIRIWPIVLGIRDNPTSAPTVTVGHNVTDLTGRKPFSYPTRKNGRKTGYISYDRQWLIGNVAITIDGWSEIKDQVQIALDQLDIPYAVGNTGLVCKLGTFSVEKIWTDTNGYRFRYFSMGHGASGFAGCCMPVFTIPWRSIMNLPITLELVDTTGWSHCQECGNPIRPNK